MLSGEIETVGKEVKQFEKGNQVYGFVGSSFGAYAEYKCMSESEIRQGGLAIKPSNMSYDEAAAISYGGILALHFMKRGNIKHGQKVLVYGASGAIGTVAIQLAKCYGAEVTGVCSTTNFTLVKSLGADKVIDYTKEDAKNKLNWRLMISFLMLLVKKKTSHLKLLCRKSLKHDGKYVSVDDGFLKLHPEYFIRLREFIEAGKIKAVIDRRYTLEQIVEAHRYVDKGHKRGNVVISF